MDDIFSDMERVVDALTGPLGDYAPRRRHLVRRLTERNQNVHRNCCQKPDKYKFFWIYPVAEKSACQLTETVCYRARGEGERRQRLLDSFG